MKTKRSLRTINHVHQSVFMIDHLNLKGFTKNDVKEALKLFRKLPEYDFTAAGVINYFRKVFGKKFIQSGVKRYTSYSINISKEEAIEIIVREEKVDKDLVYNFGESYEAKILRNLYQITRFAKENNNIGVPIVELKSMFNSTITDYESLVNVINGEYTESFSHFSPLFKLVELPHVNLYVVKFNDNVDLDSLEICSKEYYFEWGGKESELKTFKSELLEKVSRKLKENYYILNEFYNKSCTANSNELKNRYIKENTTLNTYGLLKKVENTLFSLLNLKVQFESVGKNKYRLSEDELITALIGIEDIYQKIFNTKIISAKTVSEIEDEKTENEAKKEEKAKESFRNFILKTVSDTIFENNPGKMFVSELKYRLSQLMINITGWDVMEPLKTDNRFSITLRENSDKVIENYIIFTPETKSEEIVEIEEPKVEEKNDVGYVLVEFSEKPEFTEMYLTSKGKSLGGYIYEYCLDMNDKLSILKLLEYYYASLYSDQIKLIIHESNLIYKCKELLTAK